MFTNSEYALTGIGAQARRFYFVRSEAEELTDNEVINIKAFFASHQSEMLHYFLNRDLEDFNPNKRPTNSYTQQQISEGFRWPFDIFNEELENPDAQICTLPVVTRRYLQTLVISKSVGRNHERAVGLTPNQLSKHLETVGFRHMPHPTKDKQAMRIPIKGKQETIYVTPFGLKLGVNSWTTEDVRYCCEELNYPSEWDEDE